MRPKLLLVDDKDKFKGYASYSDCHAGEGKRHRAFVTLLLDDNNKVLLQKRKHRLFDGLWDLTAISHPLRVDGKTETYQQASDRALKKEMGIEHVQVRKVGAFNYFAQDGKNCENEYCALLTGQFNGKFRANKKEVYEAEWVGYYDFIQEVGKNPSVYTPWARETVKVLVNGIPLIVNGSPGEFKQELEFFLKEFTKFSKNFFKDKQKLVKKYPALISRFYAELEDFSSGGKAMRPFLVYLGYKTGVEKDLTKMLPVCLAIELVHTFLLIHDDIIDRSNTRRGKPTVHKKFEKGKDAHYGISQAIVAGDIALLEVVDLINKSNFSDKQKSVCIDLLVKVVLETGYGEVLDVDYAYTRPSIKEIWEVAELKTARYSFVGPMKLGAILGGANKNQLKAIEQYGLSCGKAFQLQDDILGVFGNEKTLGKSTLSDMQEGKNTILFYKTRELATHLQRRLLDRVWGNPKSAVVDLKKVQSVMEKSGAKKWCEREMAILVESSKASISKITSDNKVRNILLECTDFAIYRES